MMHGITSAIAAAVLLAGCAQATVSTSAAMERAQASAQRGAQAFERGDLPTAQAEYTTALRIHESLADTEGRARTLLSLARVAAQAGRTQQALATVGQVLNEPPLPSAATLVVAQGRAATLQLGAGDLEAARRHLDQASALCAGQCTEAASLAVLRARLALAAQQPASALQLAQAALSLPALSASATHPLAERANALRVQAQAAAALGQHQTAVDAAGAALQIDQTLGLGARVTLDLQLMAQAHRALGSVALAQQYDALANRARAAQGALRGDNAATQP